MAVAVCSPTTPASTSSFSSRSLIIAIQPGARLVPSGLGQGLNRPAFIAPANSTTLIRRVHEYLADP